MEGFCEGEQAFIFHYPDLFSNFPTIKGDLD